MARKRMFASDLIQSDRFIRISYEAQLLYFHLCLRADDEGFLRSPQAILKTLDMDGATLGGARPTQGDLRLAFEVLDARYQDADKGVILCSEFTPEQIIGFDEALGGRIAERSALWSITIQNGTSRNQRLHRPRGA